MPEIHPTAIIEDGAELAPDVRVGAYAFVGGNVKLGEGCLLHHHACVEGNTVIGPGSEVFPFALIGGRSQDLKYDGACTGVEIGARATLREYSTVHAATTAGASTQLGEDCVLLAYSHVAHDARIGQRLILSSHAAIGGHVVIGDHVNIGWNAGIHQFCRVGDYAMVGACAKTVQDVPPYFTADGNPARLAAVNRLALQRAGFSEEDINTVGHAFRLLSRHRHGPAAAIEHLNADPMASSAIFQHLIAFIQASQRGLV